MLRCFVEVVETGSFTLAGVNIGLTQSGVSVKIRRLEERLSTSVFNRTSKSLSLTHEGDMLLEYARRILAMHDEAVSRFTQPRATGSLRVGLIDYFLPDLLPGLLGKFKKRYPNIHLEVRTEMGIHLIPRYERGELDLVVAGGDSYSGEGRVLVQEPLVWVVGSDAEIFQDEVIPLAVLPSQCSFRKIATEQLDKVKRKWEILFTGTSIANIQAAVQAGIGLGMLPKGALKEGIRKAPAHLNLPELPMYSIVIYTDDKKSCPARDIFITYLEAELNNIS